MAPTEPWQTRQKEGEIGKDRMGEKTVVNKKSTTEVESEVGAGPITNMSGVSPPLPWRGKIQDLQFYESPFENTQKVFLRVKRSSVFSPTSIFFHDLDMSNSVDTHLENKTKAGVPLHLLELHRMLMICLALVIKMIAS